jgi:hypothetical protein
MLAVGEREDAGVWIRRREADSRDVEVGREVAEEFYTGGLEMERGRVASGCFVCL